MQNLLDGVAEVDGMRYMRLSGTYNRYVPITGPRQWHRIPFDEWLWIKQDPDERYNFLMDFTERLVASGMKLLWLTPRFVTDNDGKKWAYWKAVRAG
jgi:hypothetical protein